MATYLPHSLGAGTGFGKTCSSGRAPRDGPFVACNLQLLPVPVHSEGIISRLHCTTRSISSSCRSAWQEERDVAMQPGHHFIQALQFVPSRGDFRRSSWSIAGVVVS